MPPPYLNYTFKIKLKNKIMSDYVRKKVIRLPFPEEIITKCNAGDIYDCEPYLKELLGELFDRETYAFQLECTDGGSYIDWVCYSTYGEESGNYGYVRLLTQKELDTIRPYFDKLGVDYNDEELRLVDYCYYNCCEAPDFYSIKNSDDSHLFLSKKQYEIQKSIN